MIITEQDTEGLTWRQLRKVAAVADVVAREMGADEPEVAQIMAALSQSLTEAANTARRAKVVAGLGGGR